MAGVYAVYVDPIGSVVRGPKVWVVPSGLVTVNVKFQAARTPAASSAGVSGDGTMSVHMTINVVWPTPMGFGAAEL